MNKEINKGWRPKNCPRCNRPKTQCICWRPTKFTESTLKKLKEAFLMDFNDVQACSYAGISETSLYNYQKKYPEFLKEKRLLKENLKMKTKFWIYKRVTKQDWNALKFVAEKLLDEYKDKGIDINLNNFDINKELDKNQKSEIIKRYLNKINENTDNIDD